MSPACGPQAGPAVPRAPFSASPAKELQVTRFGCFTASTGVPLAPIGEAKLKQWHFPYVGGSAADVFRWFQSDIEAVP